MNRVHDTTGTPMAATFDLDIVDGTVSLVLNSAGGATGYGGVPRNADYARGLETILRRLAQLGATLTDAYVDSSQVQHLPLDQRRLNVTDWPYPIRLVDVTDFDALRLRLTGAQKAIGKSSAGNQRKRTRLQIEVPGFPPTSDSIDRLALVISLSQTPPSSEPDVGQASKGTSAGQGFSADTPTKLAVEAAAMAAAQLHYEQKGWKVADVSAKESYDLLCHRGDERLRVEVKGSTLPPARILLTPNEVSHALAHTGGVALFVLSDIAITTRDGVPTGTGGTAAVFEPWLLDLDRLTATGYSYALDGLS